MNLLRSNRILLSIFVVVLSFQSSYIAGAQPGNSGGHGGGNGRGNGNGGGPCSQPPCGGPNQVPVDARLLFVLGAAFGAYLLKVKAEKKIN